MPLPIVSKAAIGAAPVSGPYSQYLGGEELTILIHVVRAVAPRTMIEFGCNDGRTAKRILENVSSIELYIGIDVTRGHQTELPLQQTEIPLVAGYHVLQDSRFVLLEQDSRTIDGIDPCNAVFIDADHSYDAVIRDSELARKWLRPGGVIVWHDYGNPAVEVTAALDHLHASGWPIVHVDGTWLAMFHK